jgi:uncharacterized protein (UPF0264 family)
MPQTKLLVSVAAPAEVDAAIAGGADVVDVKDPTQGAIGRASPQCLAEAEPLDFAEQESLRGVSLVKLGTARLAERSSAWRANWESWHASLPAGIAIAIVHYADWRRSHGLDLEATLALADEVKAAALVVDTHDKRDGHLLDFYPPPQLRAVVETIRSRRMEVVLAGSLGMRHLASVLDAAPSLIGVRGAACQQGHREGPICLQQVAALKGAINGYTRQSGSLVVSDPSLSG